MNLISFSIFGPDIRTQQNSEEEDSTLHYISNVVRRVFNLSSNSNDNNNPINTEDLLNNTLLSVNPSDCESQEDCSICRESIQPYQIIRTIKRCDHRFHQNCIDSWFIQHHTCPICRQPIIHTEQQQPSRNRQQPQESSSIFRFPVQFEFDI